MIVTEEFIFHFDNCNDRVVSKYMKPNKDFYLLKNLFLFLHSTQDGYDLQKFHKGTVKDFLIDEIFTVTDLEYDLHFSGKRGISDFRWKSMHSHILERYKLYYNDKNGNTKFKIYHIPIDEYEYKTIHGEEGTKRFYELRELCQNTVGLKQFKVKRKPPYPGESLIWLKEYLIANNISLEPFQLELIY